MKAHKVLPERAPLDMPRHRVNEPGQALRQHSIPFFTSFSTVLSRLFIEQCRSSVVDPLLTADGNQGGVQKKQPNG